MEITFALRFNVSEKTGKRAKAVAGVGYLFSGATLINGFLVYCKRPLDEHQIANGVGENLVAVAEDVINAAYNILYGEENDQE
jgi:hypothetical protein